jgi:LuxR family glucitol operon transcriptional activator
MLPLTREYAFSELATQPSLEHTMRERWVKWYRDFVEKFGGKDWGDWRMRYDRLEEEWENLLAVFGWCALHEKYEDIQIFWQEKSITKFAHIYGFWDDRLFWLDWLIQAAEKRGDWPNAIKAMIDVGSTFILMNQFEKANQYLQRGLELRPYASSQIQVLLLQKIAYFFILQEDFTHANERLDQAEILLKSLSLDEPEHTRRWADFHSNKGLFFYKQKDYNRAKPLYQEMDRLARSVGHRRLVDFAQNHLAYIALVQERLDEAESLLQISLPISKDKRLAAFHKYVLACFYQKKKNFTEARLLAGEALEDFERLGMKQEASDANELLQFLQS